MANINIPDVSPVRVGVVTAAILFIFLAGLTFFTFLKVADLEERVERGPQVVLAQPEPEASVLPSPVVEETASPSAAVKKATPKPTPVGTAVEQ